MNDVKRELVAMEDGEDIVMSNLINQLPGGVAIFKVARQLECKYFNDGFASLTGRTREEVKLMLEDTELLQKGIMLEYYNDFIENLRKDNPVGKPLSFIYKVIMANGEVKWLHTSAVKIREEDGCPVYYCVYTSPTDDALLYRNLVEDSAIGVFIADRKTRTNLYLNDAMCKLSGFAADDVLTMPLKQILEKYNKEALLTDEEVASLSFDEYSEFHRTRGNRYVAIEAKAIMWNQVDSYVLYVTDETNEHKAQMIAEQALLKEKTMMEAIPGGSAIYRLKKNGKCRVEYASEEMEKLSGYSFDEIRNLTDIYDFIFPEDVPRVREKLLDAVKANSSINIVYRIISKAGEVIHTRLNAKVMVTDDLQSDETAVIYAVHSVLSDDSKLAMREQSYYRMILNMTNTAYFEWDRDNGFYASEDFNKYALSQGGYSSIMGGQEGIDSIYPDDVPSLRYYTKNSGLPGSADSVTVRMKMIDGSYQWTEVKSFVQRDANGEYIKLIGVLRDVNKEWIEQNKKLQEALNDAEKANRAKTAFLSRVSHDMRTPLNGILGITSFLKESVHDKKIEKDIRQLEISGKYLLDLINDTLDVSRIENGKMELHPSVCDGKEMFENMINLARPGADSKNQKFIVSTNDLHYTAFFTDVGRVEQIVLNIIGNAIKFTPEGGTIECKIEEIKDTRNTTVARIIIRDTGVGMSSDFIPTIFDAFSQADETQTNTRQGTGLGMAITKQLVDLIGGKITVESQLGKGSCFTVELPFKKATKEQIKEWEKKSRKIVDDSILKDKRVLLCEDHPLNKEIAKRILEKKNVIVEWAENGKYGVDMFNASCKDYYDLILMDVRMPVMDGLDATRNIRSLPREDALTIPIIAMTGNSFDDDVFETLEAGMNAHLSKPIDADKLFDAMQLQLSNKHVYHRTKVLVVDDIEINRDVVRAAITPNFDVIEASDGVDAVEILQCNSDINVVITDMMMMRMNGFELIEAIRANPIYDNVAIILNTQYDEMTNKNKLNEMGTDGFISKPNNPEQILKALRQAMKKRQ